MALRKKDDPLYEVYCECCWQLTRDYRIVNLSFKCEKCLSTEEADRHKPDPTLSDEDWELPETTWYRPPGGGENAA